MAREELDEPQMRLLLDSNVIIQLLRDDGPTVAAVRQATQSTEGLAVSVMTLAEVYAGMRNHEAGLTKELFDQLDQLPVTAQIAKRSGELKNTLARKGRTVELDDMLIAATALQHGYQLMTLNVKDFRGTGVEIYGVEKS